MSESAPNISQNLDLLRAIAVGSVFLSHLGFSLVGLGRFGVVLFFVHTSLVLMQSLDRMQRTAPGPRRLALAFWIRRGFRLYPLAIVCILVATALHIGTVVGALFIHPGWRDVVANLLLVQNLVGVPNVISVLWSLPLEAQMYLVLPLLFLLLPRDRVPWRSLAMWLGAVGIALLFPHPTAALMVIRFAPCFLAGVVAFEMLRSGRVRRVLPAWSWPLALLAAVAFFGAGSSDDLETKMNRAWVLALCVALLFVFTNEPARRGSRSVSHWIADRSYGIYLTHTLVFSMVVTRMGWAPLPLRVFTLGAGSVVVPDLLYRWIEKPMIGVGARISGRVLQPRQAEGSECVLDRGGAVLS